MFNNDNSGMIINEWTLLLMLPKKMRGFKFGVH